MAETEIIIRPQKETQVAAQNLSSSDSVQTGKNVVLEEKVIPLQTEVPHGPVKQNLENRQVILPLNKEVQIAGPADYIFHFAPDTVVDESLMEDFRTFAFEQKMSLENARLMARFYENYVQTQSKKQRQEQMELLKSMQKACEEDSEYGGLNFHDNMRYAKAAMLRFDDGSLAKILNDTGFGSHPEVVRFMYRVGRVLAEKDMPQAKESMAERSAAELFYPSMKK